ncbi:WecB/TagA/CpsF family glycosyltransferase [Cohnella cholangitidis]|uniref:WecB/TagA/CpsF family glycosyltransferase n=1 Tax=Cohnella cholangitidis TaxID=2598458 RepID=A0A7G5C1Y5_9BACL|nr:WecB/TagA/CpsF family glycosyltransferase [Cohnella cholangitidis]QMV43219.1 WecB/TagA/CpsF family glycosyltransferase [Cohnella cholangitidis]
MGIPSHEMLGIKVHVLNEDDLIRYVHESIQLGNDIRVIGNHNLHSLYLVHHNKPMKRYYERADLIHIDGMPLIWLGRLFGYKVNRDNRLTSLDWLPRLLKDCEKHGYKVLLLGSEPGVADKVAERFASETPGLRIKGYHGYFDKTEGSAGNEQVLQLVSEYEPDMILVGMGMPIQENWISNNVDRLKTKVVWSLGAFMDYYADIKPLPPRWMGRMGLEWLYRLLSEPRRLWKRYILEPWFIAFLLLKTLVKR